MSYKAQRITKFLEDSVKKMTRSKSTPGLSFALSFISFSCLVTYLLTTASSRNYEIALNHDSKEPSIRIIESRQRKLSYTQTNFTLDEVPIRIVSGSVHYFRTSPTAWRPILEGAKSMGLNSIETYIPWNLHEQVQGKFVFSGMLDLRLFLETAHSVGLLVLLRPGPYICSEWDMGGIPAWILQSRNRIELRSSKFLMLAESYFDAVAEEIRPYIGRPIVGLQLENEYGAYGEDSSYMYKIKEMWEARGFKKSNVMLFTSDNGGKATIENGSPFVTDEVLKTINLESDTGHRIGLLREIQSNGPAMVGEFWTGWFDHWGEPHHTRSADDVVDQVRKVLIEYEANINLYMFFGGTNFGFMNGANINSNRTYMATTTSYDYDGFMKEDGRIREEKYLPMQKMLRRFWASIGNEEMVNATRKKMPLRLLSGFSGPVYLRESIPLLDVVPIASEAIFSSETVFPMEDVGSGYGYVMYSHVLDRSLYGNDSHALPLQLGPVRDFAIIICDGKVIGSVDRNNELSGDGTAYKRTKIPANTNRIDILVENRGRVNYGRKWLHDRKGLFSNVTIRGELLKGFTIFSLPFTNDHEMLPVPGGTKIISRITKFMRGRYNSPALKDATSPPTIFRGTMWIGSNCADKFDEGTLPGTYVRAFGRGVIWINGFNIGRFHTGVSGPQRSLFVPGYILKEGENEIVVLHQNLYLVRGDPYPVVQFFAQNDYGNDIHVYDSRINA